MILATICECFANFIIPNRILVSLCVLCSNVTDFKRYLTSSTASSCKRYTVLSWNTAAVLKIRGLAFSSCAAEQWLLICVVRRSHRKVRGESNKYTVSDSSSQLCSTVIYQDRFILAHHCAVLKYISPSCTPYFPDLACLVLTLPSRLVYARHTPPHYLNLKRQFIFNNTRLSF